MKYLQKISSASEMKPQEHTVLYYNSETKSITVKVSTCTVTFKDYDGSVISTKTYKYGETVVVPQFEGTWENHTFIGWGDITIDTAKADVVYIAQYEVTPKVTLTIGDSYTDTASIALNATKTETVTGTISFTTDLAADVAEITDNVLTFKKHYEGSVVVTASATDVHGNTQSDTKPITVSCNGADTVECAISDVNTPEVDAAATSATVTYKCNVTTTTHAGASTTVTANKEKTVTFEANESEEARDITSSFTCEHGEVVNYTVKQEGKPSSPYKAVDLGLSVNWASCNVGASKPEEYGLLFQWGATEGHGYDTDAKDYSTWSTAPFNNGADNYDATYFASVSGTACPNGVLASQYDAATANMGGSWRMPTQAELNDLTALTNEWTTENGVYGMKFTASNGNYIFIPASGGAFSGSVGTRGSYGYVWSSSLSPDNPSSAWYLYFNSGYMGVYDDYRYYGFSVRGVASK
ncbi:MAG: fibrobacter succinogenes major paralogous domain-containing protein [Bacilli bacterium]|nr:fibrobacter succinogenes major paralogous domain-containing protein [Bacilli bacterium]